MFCVFGFQMSSLYISLVYNCRSPFVPLIRIQKSPHQKLFMYLCAYLDVMINWLIYYCFNFLIYIGLLPINNTGIVSGGQQRDSTNTYTRIHSPANTPPIHGAQTIEQRSLCYIVGPCWLSILNRAVCTWPSQTPWLSLLPILCRCFFFHFFVKS